MHLPWEFNLQCEKCVSVYLNQLLFVSRVHVSLHFFPTDALIQIPWRKRVDSFAYFIKEMSRINAKGCHHLWIITIHEGILQATQTDACIHIFGYSFFNFVTFG